jgi:hypothetical protein
LTRFEDIGQMDGRALSPCVLFDRDEDVAQNKAEKKWIHHRKVDLLRLFDVI